MAGMYDSHVHLRGTGEWLSLQGLPSLRGLSAPTPDRLQSWWMEVQAPDRIRTREISSRNQWILGLGWDHQDWEKPFRGILPTAEILDAVPCMSNTPIGLIRSDGHALWVNSLGLSLLEAEGFRPQVGDSSRQRGLLTEGDSLRAQEIIMDHFGVQGGSRCTSRRDRIRGAFRRGIDFFRGAGFSHIRDLSGTAEDWEILSEMLKSQGSLPPVEGLDLRSVNFDVAELRAGYPEGSGTPDSFLIEQVFMYLNDGYTPPLREVIEVALEASHFFKWSVPWSSFLPRSLQGGHQLVEEFPGRAIVGSVGKLVGGGLVEKEGFGFGLRGAGVKLFYDGTLGTQTALLSEGWNRGCRHFGGPIREGGFWEKAHFQEVLGEIWKAGLPACVHVIGDEAVHQVVTLALEVLDSLSHSSLGISSLGASSRPFGVSEAPALHLEHLQLVRPETIALMKKLPLVRAFMQPSHYLLDHHFLREILPPSLRKYLFPWRALVEAGISVHWGSDSPIGLDRPGGGLIPGLRTTVRGLDLAFHEGGVPPYPGDPRIPHQSPLGVS